MSQRGSQRGSRDGRSRATARGARRDADGPRRERPAVAGARTSAGNRARLRRGISAKRASGAARVLGMSNTRRAALVAIVVCALAFTLAVPLRTYLSQRSEVTVQEQQRAELRDEVARLETRKAELSDPAQVEAEARRRLRYVMPGETPYMVQLPQDKAAQQQQQPGTPQEQPQGAWYERLWQQAGG